MNKALGGLIAVTCIAVLAAVGWYLYSERQRVVAEERAAEIQARATQMAIERLKADAEKTRREQAAKQLTPIICNSLAQQTIPDAPGQPAKTSDHDADLKLCAEFDRLGSYELHQLKLSGVIK